MATLIPDTPKDCTNSERVLFERFERDLRDHPSWVVFHSLGLADHQKKIWGEVDFVVLSNKGIFVIEVKGGAVVCKDGKWTYGSGARAYTKTEGPWAQAGGGMFALQARLDKEDPRLGRLLMGFGVVMPRETFMATGPEIEQGTLLDQRQFNLNLGFYIGRLQRHWEDLYKKRHGKIPPSPTDDDIRRIRILLRPDVESSISLGSDLNGLNSEMIQLTNRQIRVARRMSANPRSIVRGRAGTGKTILALDRARQSASKGKSVLYLCFNKLLASHVKSNLALERVSSISVRHIHSLYREVIDKAGYADKLSQAGMREHDFFGKLMPSLFVDAAIEVDFDPFDVVIVDEAQDLMTSEHLDAIDIIVKDGLNRGSWHLFVDPLQNIYGGDADAVGVRLEGVGIVYDDLFENCRNTRQVAQQTSIVSGVDMAIEGAIDGVSCECRFSQNREASVQVLVREVEGLLSKGVDPADIIILSTRRRENSLIAELDRIGGLPIVDLTNSNARPGLQFSTMHAFKGLERNIVVAIDIDQVGSEEVAMLHYAGLSRARVLLIPIMCASERPGYEQQASAFGRRLALCKTPSLS